MPLKMKDLPKSERPYEKFLMYGAKSYQMQNFWQ